MEKQERILDFDCPTQVKFIDFDRDLDSNQAKEPYWIGGIAFHDKIICGRCGGTIDIEEYYEDWDSYGKEEFGAFLETDEPIFIYHYWIDINEEIKG